MYVARRLQFALFVSLFNYNITFIWENPQFSKRKYWEIFVFSSAFLQFSTVLIILFRVARLLSICPLFSSFRTLFSDFYLYSLHPAFFKDFYWFLPHTALFPPIFVPFIRMPSSSLRIFSILHLYRSPVVLIGQNPVLFQQYAIATVYYSMDPWLECLLLPSAHLLLSLCFCYWLHINAYKIRQLSHTHKSDDKNNI